MRLSEIKNFLKYATLGIISFGVGIIFLIFYYRLSGFEYRDYLEDIGIGFLTAAAIIVIVESYQRLRVDAERKRFFDDLTKGISYVLYGTIVPESITKQFIEQIISKEFFRTDYSITYKLSEAKDKPISLEGTLEIDYNVRNIASTQKNHNIHLYFKKDLLPDRGESIKIYDIAIEKKGKNIDYIKCEELNRVEDEHRLEFSKEIPIAAKEEVRITEKFRLRFSLEYRDSWCTSDSCENITFRIIYPKDKLEVNAIILHPSRNKFRDSIHDTKDGDKKWYLREGVFPFQPIEFWWYPK